MSIESAGTKTGEIPVKISYRIIELFSAGLYQSPNKAFEELVSNSYDALASSVSIFVPSDKAASNAVMWVCDNGNSMNSQGLRQLWRIGYSAKRSSPLPENTRYPIGKFGIGKLATYVLARKLTFFCKSDRQYLAVTMDYGRIDENSEESMEVILEERRLSEDEVRRTLEPLISINGRNMVPFELWGRDSEKSWTFAILSDLRPKAHEIQDGRLRWVLSTALPLSPKFKLFFNGIEVESSKEALRPIKSWVIGKKDEVVEKDGRLSSGLYLSKPCVHLPSLRNVYGQVDLYRESLVSGKSDKLGRSHGIFLLVRGRLVNLDDPLLGMPANFTYGVFNRIRITVNADELDEYLTSNRESIRESPALTDLREYIRKKFEEVKSYYFELEGKEEREASDKIAQVPSGLSRRPLLVVAKKFFDGEITSPLLIEIAPNLTEDQKRRAIEQLENDLTSETGIIKSIKLEPLTASAPISKLDLLTGEARINVLHPFFANMMEEVKSILPFQLVAVTEILTEAFMIEGGIRQSNVREIMLRRDRILRDMTFSDSLNTPRVAQLLGESLSDSGKLEQAVFHVFNNLGFTTTKIGGNGKPDGTALAYLGVRTSGGPREDYTIVYDAKSTAKSKIKAHTAHISGLVRHKNDFSAQYAAIIAIDFEGALDDNSSLSKEVKEHKITLLRAKDLMRLVLLASPRQIGLRDLRDLFENCHTVKETSSWINDLEKRAVRRGPFRELLEATYRLTVEDKEPPDLNAIRQIEPKLKEYSIADLQLLVHSIRAMAGNLVSLEENRISIQAPPRKILEIMNKSVNDVPAEVVDVYMKAFGT